MHISQVRGNSKNCFADSWEAMMKLSRFATIPDVCLYALSILFLGLDCFDGGFGLAQVDAAIAYLCFYDTSEFTFTLDYEAS